MKQRLNAKKEATFLPIPAEDIIASQLNTLGDSDDAFFVADIESVVQQLHLWRSLLPRVDPFYAIKCNPDPHVLKTLANMGIGFDCASKSEIEEIIKMGVSADRIIYAHPCKQVSHLKFAKTCGVDLMTFDNVDELHKIKKNFPLARLVLRILVDDSNSACQFGIKFGASQEICPKLLSIAKELSLNVVGVSFHVGSGCYSASAFSDAVKVARDIFDVAQTMGFNFELLDIGGGFPGANSSSNISFVEIATLLRPAIDQFFPSHIRVIAEPGRFFVADAFRLAVNIIARRVVEKDNETKYMYYLNDGVYGSFNCIIFDHVYPIARPLVCNGKYVTEDKIDDKLYHSSIWGPTCDSMDCITKDATLPEMQVGDWFVFENMGAYTSSAASKFNGFKLSRVIYTKTEF